MANTSRIVEAEIILLIWIVSAAVVSYYTVGAAAAIHSEALELIEEAGGARGAQSDQRGEDNPPLPTIAEGCK